MAEKLTMPRLGQSMEEGTIVQWYKREGDEVRKGEPLLEVMTDKANIDVEATVDGLLRRILAQADETVPVNAVIAIVGTADEPIEEVDAAGRGGEGATLKNLPRESTSRSIAPSP